MKLFHFLFIFTSFSILLGVVSCKKVCLDNTAVESDADGKCLYAPDLALGTYEVRDSTKMDSMGVSVWYAAKTYTLTIAKTDNNNVIVKNIGNCLPDVSCMLLSDFKFSFGTSGNCYATSIAVVGTGVYDKTNKDLSISYNYNGTAGRTYQSFLKAKKK